MREDATGDSLAAIHASEASHVAPAAARIANAFEIADGASSAPPLIAAVC